MYIINHNIIKYSPTLGMEQIGNNKSISPARMEKVVVKGDRIWEKLPRNELDLQLLDCQQTVAFQAKATAYTKAFEVYNVQALYPGKTILLNVFVMLF